MLLGESHSCISIDVVLLAELHPWSVWLFDQLGAYPLVGILVSLMFLDVATGMLAAAINKQLSSKVSWKGMCRKAVMILVVGFAVILENPSLGHQFPVSKLVSLFYIGHEGLSILENANAAGVPFPIKLKNMLMAVKHADKTPHPLHLQVDAGTIKELSESGIIRAANNTDLKPNPKHPPKSRSPSDSIHE